MSTGTTLGRGMAEALSQGNDRFREDLEKIKRFINEETGFKFSYANVTSKKLKLTAKAKNELS